MTSDGRRPDPGFHQEPILVGRRRASTAPLVAIVVLTAFVGAALLKPWEGGPAPLRSAGPAASRPPVAGASSSIGPAASPDETGALLPGRPFRLPTDVEVVDAARVHPDWGVRAVIAPGAADGAQPPTSPVLADQWQAIGTPPDAPAVEVGTYAVGPASDDEVLALGVTTPADALALDVRIWAIADDGTLRRESPRPIAGPETGSLLWRPDPRDVTRVGGWPGGKYRIDVLLAKGIVRVAVDVQTTGPRVLTNGPIPAPQDLAARLATTAPGVFAFNSFDVLPVVVDPGGPLDERESWLVGTGSGIDSRIGRIRGAPIAGLGLLVRSLSEPTTFRVDEVSPIVDTPAISVTYLPVPSRGDQQTAILVRRLDATAWASGSYHLIAEVASASSDPGRLTTTTTWNLDIAPTNNPVTPSDTLRRLDLWTRELDDPSVAFQQPLITSADLGEGKGAGTCGGPAAVRSDDVLFGLVSAPDVSVIRMRMLSLGVPVAADVPLSLALNVVPGVSHPGLTLIAVPWAGLSARDQELVVDVSGPAGPERLVYTVCVR